MFLAIDLIAFFSTNVTDMIISCRVINLQSSTTRVETIQCGTELEHVRLRHFRDGPKSIKKEHASKVKK